MKSSIKEYFSPRSVHLSQLKFYTAIKVKVYKLGMLNQHLESKFSLLEYIYYNHSVLEESKVASNHFNVSLKFTWSFFDRAAKFAVILFQVFVFHQMTTVSLNNRLFKCKKHQCFSGKNNRAQYYYSFNLHSVVKNNKKLQNIE